MVGRSTFGWREILAVLAIACRTAPAEDVQVSIGHIDVSGQSVDLYVRFIPDGAALGFSLLDVDGSPRYFPLYMSTSRKLPDGELTVLISPSGDAMWFTTTWTGYELLGYHHFGDDYSVSRYGRVPGGGSPAPEVLGGDPAPIPPVVDGASRMVRIVLPIEPRP